MLEVSLRDLHYFSQELRHVSVDKMLLNLRHWHIDVLCDVTETHSCDMIGTTSTPSWVVTWTISTRSQSGLRRNRLHDVFFRFLRHNETHNLIRDSFLKAHPRRKLSCLYGANCGASWTISSPNWETDASSKCSAVPRCTPVSPFSVVRSARWHCHRDRHPFVPQYSRSTPHTFSH